LDSYESIVAKMPSKMKSNNENFCSEFEKIVDRLEIG